MTENDPSPGRIANALAEQGWCVALRFLGPAAVSALRDVAVARQRSHAFREARVGRGEQAARVPALRGDSILWLEPDDYEPAVRAVFDAFEALRVTLNRELFLGLEALEAHFAVYPPGARYGIHVDRFRDDDGRAVSVVLYLNEAWTVADGGALRLYLDRAGEPPCRDVLPEGGTLVAFVSDRFPHEVLPARRSRYSVTGWFRRRA